MKQLKAIGKRIENERLAKNMKYPAVALILDTHPNTYRNYEKGKRDMPISLLSKLDQLGFDIMYIVTGERSKVDGAVKALTEAEAKQLKTLVDIHKKMSEGKQKTIVSQQIDELLNTCHQQ